MQSRVTRLLSKPSIDFSHKRLRLRYFDLGNLSLAIHDVCFKCVSLLDFAETLISPVPAPFVRLIDISVDHREFFVTLSQWVTAAVPVRAPDDNDAADAFASITTLSELDALFQEELGSCDPVDPRNDFLITDERIAQEVQQLQQKTLSPELAAWVERYGEVGDRNPYLWAWCRQGVEITTLSSISDDFDELCDTKVLGVMLDVLLDDVADQGGDAEFLDALIRIPFATETRDWSRFAPDERHYAELAAAVWDELHGRIKRLPRFEEFDELLRFDYHQLTNTMRYSHLLNRFPPLLNLAEHDLYLPHNMHMMVSATIDLMASIDFDFAEIGRLREAVWHAQYMGRIGNLITTWERELYEQDFTSGVFAHAIVHGDVSLECLISYDRDLVKQAIRDGGHEEYFLNKWQEHRRRLLDLQGSIHSVDLGRLISGLERLICLHLASRGHK